MSTPTAPLLLALYEPDIAQNAGAMMRTCACFGVDAAIIEPAGFRVGDSRFRRAGMDYLDAVSLARHDSWAKFEAWRAAAGRRLTLLTTRGETRLWDFAFRPGDILLVGRESAGAPRLGGRVGGRAPANPHPAAVAVAQRRGRRDDRIGRSPSPDRPPATGRRNDEIGLSSVTRT